ncbi:MAG: DUF2293 domain-containing protein [Planctomycetota bacterium]
MTDSPTFLPGPEERTVRTAAGSLMRVPNGWELLPPGDPGWTRRVKAAGDHWVVQEKRGRKVFSRGVWAPAETIARVAQDLQAERSTEAYTKKRAADSRRRDQKQAEYVDDFTQAVVRFLDFHPKHTELAQRMAERIASHATPVGSGTVARTERIPIERRAEAAVIAWMRHQTTAYDHMKIARIRGERREVRRMLAARSRELLDQYRRGQTMSESCPLIASLSASQSKRELA